MWAGKFSWTDQTCEGEKQSGENREDENVRRANVKDSEWSPRKQEYSCQFPVANRQQCWQCRLTAGSPLTANHSFCIVNKQFKRKCQPSDRKSNSGYNVSFLLPVHTVVARLPGKWRTGWVMRMARTTCSVGGDSNEGWHDAFYSPSRQCDLTQYFSHLLSKCWSVMDPTMTYKWLMGEKGGEGGQGMAPIGVSVETA